MRITCIVRVLPPLTTSPARKFVHAALASARGSTPGCERKRLSSAAIAAAANFSGTGSRAGKRHCPSAAIRAPSSDPSRASRTDDTGWSKSVSGSRVAKPAATTKPAAKPAHQTFRGCRRARRADARSPPRATSNARATARLAASAAVRTVTALRPPLPPPPAPPSPRCVRTPRRRTSPPPTPPAGSSRPGRPR